MKAIVIKYKEKPICVHQICDLTTQQFLNVKKECEHNIESFESFVEHQCDRIRQLEEHVMKLEEKCNDLYHQIAIDRGEEEPEPTGTCYTEDGKLEEVYFDPNEEPQPELAEETTEVSK